MKKKIGYPEIIVIVLLLLTAAACFGQNYRVRAVRDTFYIQDTISIGDPLHVYSPFIKEFVFQVQSDRGFPLSVLTSINQGFDTRKMQPGSYNWSIVWKDSTGLFRSREGMIIFR
jgi:hypothetical protein